MLFNSFSFGIFFAILFFAYFTVPKSWRTWLLLVASCYFYMAFVPYYILILFFLITVDFVLAQRMQHATGRERKRYLYVSLTTNLGTLFFFKYFNFFNQNISYLAHALNWQYSIGLLEVVLPLGLSFHVFQSLSYVIEVYKGRYPAERSYIHYALYVMFFPQLVAGPIERPAQLLPQLHAEHDFTYEQVVSGLRLMLWGFFKKLVIADWLGVSVNFIYAHLGAADGSVLLFALLLFPLQLYADFSGYSDIAVGSARVLGIDLVRNFQRPFFATSIAEFWRRWHISLSFWFRDYVYYPLAYSWGRRGVWGIYAATMATFGLVGLWHGGAWTYVTMGALFGFYICVGQWSKKFRDAAAKRLHIPNPLRRLAQIASVYALTSIAQVFFRAPSMHDALTLITGVFTNWSAHAFWFLHCSGFCANYVIGISKTQFVLILLSLALLFGYELFEEGVWQKPRWLMRPWTTMVFSYCLILWILLNGYFLPQTFIYFQF